MATLVSFGLILSSGGGFDEPLLGAWVVDWGFDWGRICDLDCWYVRDFDSDCIDGCLMGGRGRDLLGLSFEFSAVRDWEVSLAAMGFDLCAGCCDGLGLALRKEGIDFFLPGGDDRAASPSTSFESLSGLVLF